MDEALSKLGFGPFQILITVFCGLVWLNDSMELAVVSIISVVLKCQWELTSFGQSIILISVIVGYFIGGLCTGIITQAIGRRNSLFVFALIIIIFGVLSSLEVSSGDMKIPGYPWFLFCRFGVGFGTSGTSQVLTYYVEYLPSKGRGVCIILLEVWWCLGGMLAALLALVVIVPGGLGWHWYLGLITIPQVLSLFIFFMVPESVRFYLVKGKNDKAQKVIERIAWYNCKNVPPGRVVAEGECQRLNHELNHILSNHEGSEERGGNSYTERTNLLTSSVSKIKNAVMELSPLFTGGMWKTTVMVSVLWTGAACLYYSVILLCTYLVLYDPHCNANELNVSNLSNSSTSECDQLDTEYFIKLLWTAAAELPGLLLTMLIIDLLGRKITMAIEFLCIAIGLLLLLICGPDTLLTSFLFIVRAFSAGVYQTIYVYTPEVYPTNVRALAMGYCSSVSRVGLVVVPFVPVFLQTSDYATLSLYSAFSLVLAVLALLLPIETKGRALRST